MNDKVVNLLREDWSWFRYGNICDMGRFYLADNGPIDIRLNKGLSYLCFQEAVDVAGTL